MKFLQSFSKFSLNFLKLSQNFIKFSQKFLKFLNLTNFHLVSTLFKYFYTLRLAPSKVFSPAGIISLKFRYSLQKLI